MGNLEENELSFSLQRILTIIFRKFVERENQVNDKKFINIYSIKFRRLKLKQSIGMERFMKSSKYK
jgi:hypothetical protein